ncbi:Hypothetical predicted protein [Podarcis lilfordi]|uniref:Transmembrane protein 100 n=1 Tax=Podarcis lilfordi TaxID=74358 RepID=A0AA35L9X4_9SAUR|nr:Hypothetical predicted protein [Podarcis lilfordi]
MLRQKSPPSHSSEQKANSGNSSQSPRKETEEDKEEHRTLLFSLFFSLAEKAVLGAGGCSPCCDCKLSRLAWAPAPVHLARMMGCKSNSLTCLQGGKPGLPAVAATTDSTATLNKLALATGGTEKSWYRCVFPFGIVSLVIGIAATCITFTINGRQMDIAKVVSVATLIFGVGLLVGALVCWRAKRQRQRKKQQEEPASVEQGAL